MNHVSHTPYIVQHSLTNRKAESRRIKEKYPDRVPVICERNHKCNDKIPYINKNKYLVPYDLTVGQFMFVIRKRLVLDPSIAIYFMSDNGDNLLSSMTIGELYDSCDSVDGFLYIKYCGESTFG